jgi:predicted DNA-binding antitoxin AbrB/MazE fold protein
MGMGLKVKARYEDKVLKPLEAVDLEEGDEVELEVRKSAVERLEGVIHISRRKWVDALITSPDLEPL